jgi:transposase-like protein
MSERAAPFYCPYCGDEDLRPDGESHAQWRCTACLRVFELKYRGTTGRNVPDGQRTEVADDRRA